MNNRPLPEQRSRNSPSLEKKERAPPHWESTSMFMVAARNEPDCTIRVSPRSSRTSMSPGRGGAMVTSPWFSAVKVLTKKLSPPRTERLSPPNMPPRVLVSILMVSDMLTIAPVSACNCSRAVHPHPGQRVRWSVKNLVIHEYPSLNSVQLFQRLPKQRPEGRRVVGRHSVVSGRRLHYT